MTTPAPDDSRGQQIKTIPAALPAAAEVGRGVWSIDEFAGGRHDVSMPTSPDPLRYAFKASLAGIGWQYELRDSALHWQANARHGSVYYRDIARVWMSYRPTSMQSNRFRTDIRSHEGQKLPVYSVNFKTIALVEAQSEPYRQLVLELHRRIVAGGGKTEFRGGLSWPVFVIGVAAAGAVMVASIALLVSAVVSAMWAGVFFMLGISALFVWQIGGYLWRNRPCIYDGANPPERLLPRGEGETHPVLRLFQKLRVR